MLPSLRESIVKSSLQQKPSTGNDSTRGDLPSWQNEALDHTESKAVFLGQTWLIFSADRTAVTVRPPKGSSTNLD